MLPQTPEQGCHVSILQGRAWLTLPRKRPGLLLGVEHFTLDAVHPNRARCKHAMKDEGGINKLQDFSETTYCKCDRFGWVGDSVKYSEKSLAPTVLSHSHWSYS